jgi:hypothetical protein
VQSVAQITLELTIEYRFGTARYTIVVDEPGRLTDGVPGRRRGRLPAGGRGQRYNRRGSWGRM